MWYISPVTLRSSRLLLLCLLALPACGKKIDRQTRDAVRQFDGLDLPREQVEIIELRESGDFAIAELRVSTAVKLRKEAGRWVIDEVRLGDRHWEKAESILAALEARRETTTRALMGRIAEGLSEFLRREGRFPDADSFEALVDELAPEYMADVIRLDAWSRPFQYELRSPGRAELRSAGADGVFETADDLVEVTTR